MINTVEQARSLPEIRDEFSVKLDFSQGGGIESDDIMLFVDSDGITKKVVFTTEGPKKVVWYG